VYSLHSMNSSTTGPQGTTDSPTRERGVRSLGGYHAGLDGIRAIAVVAVLAFHAELPGMSAGFLGVSQFFTLSGFLITTILLDDHHRNSGIDFRRFWARRFRRLMPAALLGLLGAILFGATIATRSQADDLPEQVGAAAVYLSNWQFISSSQSYADLFSAPSPVSHYWSLAIEEQFYLLLPLALAVMLARSTSLRLTAGIFAGLALVSSAWMFVLYEGGASVDRLYYGTDTRLAELLAGSALAAILLHIGTDWSPKTRRLLSWIGVGALALTIWAWGTFTLDEAVLWRGGLLAHALVTCVVIVAILAATGPLHTVLASAPLAAIGRISYGIYVFHWPIFLWLTEERTDLGMWPLFALRTGLTLVVAIASYNLVEMPVRRGGGLSLPVSVRLAIAPLAVVAVVAAGYAFVGDGTSDGLETLREEEALLDLPVLSDDGVLDVVAITTEGGQPFVAELEGLISETSTINVAATASFACLGGLVEHDGQSICANWVEEWPPLVEAHDPDVILLFADDWEGDDLEELSGLERPGQATFVADVVDAGFDLLTSQGAPVVWATSTVGLEESLRRFGRPLAVGMQQVEQRRTDLNKTLTYGRAESDTTPVDELQTETVLRMLNDLLLYQRGTDPDLLRVMVVGDSQGRSLGYGLERWGLQNEFALVRNIAAEGCGLLDDGFIEGFLRETPISDECQRVKSSWAGEIESFDPDLVIVFSTFIDLREHRLEEWPEPLVVGSPDFDAYMLSEYRDAVELLSAEGAAVLWMTAPCGERGEGTILEGPVGRALAPDRLAILNDQILPALAEDDAITLFPLDDVLCPNGEPLVLSDGPELRPDGLHFGAEGSLWFAETYGADLLAYADGPSS